MAFSGSSSSASSSDVRRSTRNHNSYEVFVSFRGKDTRLNFTDHLFGALQRKGIIFFKDDADLEKGKSLAPELLRAIEASQIYIVVFSKNYASSTWSLGELRYILECVRVPGKCALPVFYDVDPSDVRKQSGSYAEAFAQHEKIFKQDLNMVHGWREALTEVANLCGWDVRDKPELAEIEKIVEKVKNILGHKFSSIPKDLVGMDPPIEELETLLRLDKIDDVWIIGISGMGGIGKTTLANVLYARISHQFDAVCFVDDVSKIYRHDGPIGAQKQILDQTLGEEHLQINNLHSACNLIRSRLSRKRALIILDNIDKVEQLEKLELSRDWLGAGSRIIIISRDEQIMKNYGVNEVYEVPLLNETDALQLFSQKAFKLDHIKSGYEKLADDIITYAGGLPLVTEVLGSFLFGRDISEWRSTLDRLRKYPTKDDINMDVLRLSFDGLEETEKEIFLHIACYFCKQEVEYVKNILNCCGFHASIGFRVLIDKSFISISRRMVKMPDLLILLGGKIAQENFTVEPRKWTRLWHDAFDFPLEFMENAEAICWNACEEKMEIPMGEALTRMRHLRLLILRELDFPGKLVCLSSDLRYLEWEKYPFMYLPSNFQPNQLVEIILKHSSITKVWEGRKHLPNLRTMDLSYSKGLIKTPHFEEVPNLERLNLEGCVKLVVLDPSIGVLGNLVFLNLKDCKNLRSMPNSIFDLSSMEYLNLSGCSKLFNNSWHLNGLDTSESGFPFQLTSSILKWIPCLPFHYFYPTHEDLLHSLPSLSCLRELDIGFCGLKQLTDAIGCLHWLERLNLEGNNFVRVPNLANFSKLIYLNLQHCKHLEFFPQLPSPGVMEQDGCWTKGGMYLFNCPKLRVMKWCSRMAFSWMIQLIQANQKPYVSFDWIDIVIPGSEIPSWFDNQRKSDSIQIDSSPMDDFIGIALCSAFSIIAHDDDPITTSARACKETKLGFRIGNTVRGMFAGIPITVDRNLITVKSNHMSLIYFPRKTFFDILRDVEFLPSHIKMEAEIMNGSGLDVEVKNCGYRWVYERDLQGVSFDKFLARMKMSHHHNQNHSSD